jgi:hypothetical protein
VKVPRANRCAAAVRLRVAAIEFGAWANVSSDKDPHDREGQRRNLELLRSAIAYTRHVDRLVDEGEAERRKAERQWLQKRKAATAARAL